MVCLKFFGSSSPFQPFSRVPRQLRDLSRKYLTSSTFQKRLILYTAFSLLYCYIWDNILKILCGYNIFSFSQVHFQGFFCQENLYLSRSFAECGYMLSWYHLRSEYCFQVSHSPVFENVFRIHIEQSWKEDAAPLDTPAYFYFFNQFPPCCKSLPNFKTRCYFYY